MGSPWCAANAFLRYSGASPRTRRSPIKDTPEPAESSAPHRSAGPEDPYRWVILALVTLAQSAVVIVGLSMVPLAPFLQQEFGLNRAQLGLLISAGYTGAALVAIPIGSLTDRHGVRFSLVFAQVLVGVGMLIFSQMGSFTLLLAATMLAGLGHGAVNPPTSAAVVTWFTGGFRGTAMGIKQTGFALGNAVSAALLPSLASTIGWRGALLAACVGVLGSAGLAARFYRGFPRGAPERPAASPMGAALKGIFTNRNLVLLYASGVILAASQIAVTGYLLLFFNEAVGFPVILAGQALALSQLCGAAGRIGWGLLSDRAPGSSRRNVIALVAALSAVAMLVVSTLSDSSPVWLVLLLSAILGITAVGWNGVYFVLVAELAGPRAVASATGVAIAIVFLAVILGSPLFGWLVDLTDSYAFAWQIMAVLNLANLALIMAVRESRNWK